MVTRNLGRIGEAALDLIYPPRCALCEKQGSFLCDECLDKLPRADGQRCDVCWLPRRGSSCQTCAEHPIFLNRLRSVFRYGGEVQRLVQAFKFQGQSSLGRTLAAQLTGCYAEHAFAADIVVPVPLSGARRRRRGYNQAALLAREVARELGLPMSEAMRRLGNPTPQARSTAEQRRRNVSGVFEVAKSEAVAGRRVLLIDDVATTGATLSACAEALLATGASEVIGLTLARED